jgi:hypothetical protein
MLETEKECLVALYGSKMARKTRPTGFCMAIITHGPVAQVFNLCWRRLNIHGQIGATSEDGNLL